MTKVNTTIRLDIDLKKEAMDIAGKLGTNLSTIISLYLKNNFLVKKGISVNIRDEYGFTKEAREDLEKAINAPMVSKPYSNVKDLFDDLDNNAVKY